MRDSHVIKLLANKWRAWQEWTSRNSLIIGNIPSRHRYSCESSLNEVLRIFFSFYFAYYELIPVNFYWLSFHLSVTKWQPSICSVVRLKNSNLGIRPKTWEVTAFLISLTYTLSKALNLGDTWDPNYGMVSWAQSDSRPATEHLEHCIKWRGHQLPYLNLF